VFLSSAYDYPTSKGAFLSRPVFRETSDYGVVCLLLGWIAPLPWIANLWLLAGLILLLCRRTTLAFCLGVVALLCGFLPFLSGDRDELLIGAYLWLGSLIVFAVGTFCLWVRGRASSPPTEGGVPDR
jgi:hypothetical protein